MFSGLFFQINGKFSPCLRLPASAKVVMHPCLPELSREHFFIRFDSQQHRPTAQAFSPLRISYLTKPTLSPTLSQTDNSPVV